MTNEEDDAIFGPYVALWHRAQDEGAYVRYEGSMPVPGSAGHFHPRNEGPPPHRSPLIGILRPSYAKRSEPTKQCGNGTTPDLLAELFTLAHEYGHFVSYKAGGRTLAYAEAVKHLERRKQGTQVKGEGPLSEGERELIRREEKLAWAYGRKTLVELGFGGITDYDRVAAEHLGIYEKVFELDVADVG